MAEDVTVLREILQRELETINAYEAMLLRISDPKLRQIVEHITDEEREHVAEMYELITEYDPRQRALTQKSQEDLTKLVGSQPIHPQQSAAEVAGALPLTGEDPVLVVPAGGPGGAVDLIPPPPPVFHSSAWSVGSLKRAKP